MGVKITLDTGRLDELTNKTRPVAELLVASTAFEVQAEAQMNAPVDTGALRSSVEAEKIAPLVWQVHDGVEYGVHVEFGTSHSAAQPFLTPAVESKRQQFIDSFRKLFE